MQFSTRAKITVATGLSAATIFLALGIRELGRPSASVAATPVALAAAPQPMMLPLATAGRPIAIGETITAASIRTAGGSALQNATIASPAEVIGKVATRAIPAGALIDRAAIDTENKLAIRVPVGMRAMSIDTSAEIAVAGLIRPGDRVDVQVVYPGEDAITGLRPAGGSHAESHARTLLQMVQVLAVGDLVVGTKPAADGGTPAAGGGTSTTPAPPPARTVTVALSPDQVSTLSLAKNTGALYLSLRNPTDQVVTETADPAPRPATTVVRTASAARIVRRPRAAQSQPIELVIGDRREIIHSGSSAK